LQVHCVNSDIPVERLGASSGGFYETTYNSGVMFRGAYIGRDIRVMRLTKPILRVHLEVLESLTQVNNSAFKPPPDAVEVERRSLADGSVIAGKLLNKKQPEYPMFAKSQRIQGTVTLGAVIGRDGKISDVEPLGGPPELYGSSIDAVKRWVYEPYTLNGEPVSVETVVQIVYSLRSN
jgi:TonB family protein